MAADLALGFADPVADSQSVFRAVMDALARPGTIRPLATALRPPAPLTSELAAVALALADHEAALWLDAPLAAVPDVAEFLRFHTGATIVAEPERAAFALIADTAALPPFERFAIGTDAFPDRSTTLVCAVAALTGGPPIALAGPGIKGRAALAVRPLPADFAAQARANHRLFPRGVDLLFVAAGGVAALPRSTSLPEV
ncbi:phosphonate C-P lyase system protein PhnH [Labrys wisconsinensis]|uniref:Alpha-D-ribose 1-methylphosphonate 5-triphosphate synthase subunit PhnH n=1 Tax=Labrys wisconsinensis TaxID=425677 RepID=A0ABU0JAA7_9HYPH|nr:phosphonate C-P lyase system protein PhnH [Labrys wisconsinensis]MDQ0471205.1 alpha-D-ribose 1-methylphosphonate 5-triphosphate synthase subunit PhnH [Labrys wisconsinensis]